jgi:hypothetical protein
LFFDLAPLSEGKEVSMDHYKPCDVRQLTFIRISFRDQKSEQNHPNAGA